MARPTKYRTVEFFPEGNYFIPWEKKDCEIEEVEIKVEELEAIRLKDIEGLTQEECASKMEISRQTFQNIIESGRKKIAIALTEGKAIRIAGGHYTTKFCKFKCAKCGYVYTVKYEQDKIICPKCSSTEVMCGKKESFCKKWCCKKR